MRLLEVLLNLSSKLLHSRLEPIDSCPKLPEFIVNLIRSMGGNAGLIHDATAAIDVDAVGEIVLKILESLANRGKHTSGADGIMLRVVTSLSVRVRQLANHLHLQREVLILATVPLQRPGLDRVLVRGKRLLTLLARKDGAERGRHDGEICGENELSCERV